MADTPFGKMTDQGQKAPTRAEVNSNPGAYDGTSFDPTKVAAPSPRVRQQFSKLENEEAGAHVTFADWYKADPEGALEWYNSPGNKGGDPSVPNLNLSKLSAGQKERMGIK